MLVFFVFLVAVTPVPVIALFLAPEVVIVDVCPVSRFQPATIDVILAPVPAVVILVIRVVDATFAFLLLVTLVFILWRSHSKGAEWRQQCGRDKQRRDIFLSTMHSFPPLVGCRCTSQGWGINPSTCGTCTPTVFRRRGFVRRSALPT